MPNIAGAILAGGKSTRMGEDKAKLSFNGKTLLQHMQQLLSEANIKNIYISGSKNIVDIIPQRGPLSGIHAILSEVSADFNHILFVPIDMPTLKISMIKKLILAANKADLVYFKSHRMPFLLSTNKEFLHLAQSSLTQGSNYSLGAFHAKILNQHQIEILPKEEIYFNNINNPNEWNDFQKLNAQ